VHFRSRDVVYVHSNLRLADKIQDVAYVENNVPWSRKLNLMTTAAAMTQIDIYTFVYKFDSICSKSCLLQ